ncbi:hypothetical protein C8Q77DRAFT_645579 [Trametes polyzona]|nr:hypothetical protein C8Q77DRAFT_645579 [Trametes polyzona]
MVLVLLRLQCIHLSIVSQCWHVTLPTASETRNRYQRCLQHRYRGGARHCMATKRTGTPGKAARAHHFDRWTIAWPPPGPRRGFQRSTK